MRHVVIYLTRSWCHLWIIIANVKPWRSSVRCKYYLFFAHPSILTIELQVYILFTSRAKSFVRLQLILV